MNIKKNLLNKICRLNIFRFYLSLCMTGLSAASLAMWPAWNVYAEQLPGAQVEELLDWARQHNPELAASRAEAESMAQRIDAASALPDPTLRAQSMNINDPGSTTNGTIYYTLMQAVPFWGKRDLQRELAMAESAQAQSLNSETWAELASKIKIDFAQYYLLHHSMKITQEMLSLLNNLERIAQTRYATGLAAQQDVLRAQIELTQLQREQVMLDAEHHHVIARLNTLLRRPSTALLADPQRLRVIPDKARQVPVKLEQRLQLTNPQLFAVGARLIAAEKNYELALRNRYPDFVFGVMPVQKGGQITEWGIMAEFNIPLQQGSRRAQERSASAALNAARSRKEALSTQLIGDLTEQIISLKAVQRTENLVSNSLLPQAEATLQAALAGYQTGKVDFATLLDAQRQLLQARLDVL
ncbi:MAG: TolC family protein, partial [Candidatus Nitrotoga sp.]